MAQGLVESALCRRCAGKTTHSSRQTPVRVVRVLWLSSGGHFVVHAIYLALQRHFTSSLKSIRIGTNQNCRLKIVVEF